MPNITYLDKGNTQKQIFNICQQSGYVKLSSYLFLKSKFKKSDLFIFHDSGQRLFDTMQNRIRYIINNPNDPILSQAQKGSVILEVTDGNDAISLVKISHGDNYFFYGLIPRISSLDENQIKSLIGALTFEDDKRKAIEVFYDSIYGEDHPENLIDLSSDMKACINALEGIFKSSVCFPRLWIIGKISKLVGLEEIDAKEYSSFFKDCKLTFREKVKIDHADEKYQNLLLGTPSTEKLCALSNSGNMNDVVNFMTIIDGCANKKIMLICSSDVKLGNWAFEKLQEKFSYNITLKYMLVTPQGVMRSNWPEWQRENQSIKVIQKIKKAEIQVVPLDLDYECSIFFDVNEGKESPLLPQWRELLGDNCLPALHLDSFLSTDETASEQDGTSNQVSQEVSSIEERFKKTMITIGH